MKQSKKKQKFFFKLQDLFKNLFLFLCKEINNKGY